MTSVISLQQLYSGLWSNIANPSDAAAAQSSGDNECTLSLP